MIHVTDNTCPICQEDGYTWNLNYAKSQMEMLKCGHGTCKGCYKIMQQMSIDLNKCFSCPLCREDEQQHTTGFLTGTTEKWTTFAEWYREFEIYIKAGSANNVVKHTAFGKQLLRLIKENKKKTSKKQQEKDK